MFQKTKKKYNLFLLLLGVAILCLPSVSSAINVRMNSITGNDCDTLCGGFGETCLSIGTDASGTNNKYWYDDRGVCGERTRDCTQVMDDDSIICDGTAAQWAFCRCDNSTEEDIFQIDWIYPTTSINVTQNEFFNITLNITCQGTYNCDNVSVYLDPALNELITAGNPDEYFDNNTDHAYYRNNTWQTEDWMYIETNITDADGMDSVFLEWKNETGWFNFSMNDDGGGIYSVNMTNQPNYGLYTFRIWANDTLSVLNKIYDWIFVDAEDAWPGDPEDYPKHVGLNADGSHDYCYQEHANVSTTCSSDEGVYWIDGGTWHNLSYVYDGNWSNYGYVEGTSNFLFVNYSKPSEAVSALWQIKDNATAVNITIPSACFDLSPLQLRVQPYEFLGTMGTIWYCYNTTAWDNLRQEATPRFGYEEAILWEIPKFSYEQFYLWEAPTYNWEQRWERPLAHEQPVDGLLQDTGYGYYARPTSNQIRACTSFLGFHVDETLTIEETEVNNIYVHTWWSTKDMSINMSVQHSLEQGFTTPNQSLLTFRATNTTNVSSVNITEVCCAAMYNLEIGYHELNTPINITDNDLNLLTYTLLSGGAQTPKVVSRINYGSFIIYNLPDNETLKDLDTDSDGLSDFDELYTYYTDPKERDTDLGGKDDYSETVLYPNSDPLHPNDDNATKDGYLVSTVEGVVPFYTNASNNPLEVNITDDNIVTFWVNATGHIDITHVFYAWANITGNETINNITTQLNITIKPAAPYILDATVNVESPIAISTTPKINATIISGTYALDSTWLDVNPPISAAYNASLSNSGNEYYNDSITLDEYGNWTFTFYANGTSGAENSVMAQDLNGEYNITVSDAQVSISLVYPNGSLNVSQNKFFNVTVNVSCDTEVGCGEINVSLDPEPPPITTRTVSSETICIGDKCTKTLYSGTMFENNGSDWLPLPDIVGFDWLGNEFSLYYKNNPDINITLQPYVNYVNGNNYTVQDIHDIFPSANIKDKIDFGRFDYKFSLNMSVPQNLVNNTTYIAFKLTEANGLDWDDVEVKDRAAIIKGRYRMDFNDLIESGFTLSRVGREFRIGNLSANYRDGSLLLDPTIQLQDADSENLEDTMVFSNNPLTNYGDTTPLYAYNDEVSEIAGRSYINFNLSEIINLGDVTIDNSTLYLYLSHDYGDEDVSVHHMYAYFNESSVVWNNQPCGTVRLDENYSKINSTYCNQTYEDIISSFSTGWENWNVTNAVSRGVLLDNNNISFLIITDEKNGADATANGFRFYPKEGASSSTRPYLNVTYTLISSSKTGLVNATIGATPFYTNESNPRNISLDGLESQLVTFWVNATGDVGTNHTFFAFANLTYNLSLNDITDTFNVTITEPSTTYDRGISTDLLTSDSQLLSKDLIRLPLLSIAINLISVVIESLFRLILDSINLDFVLTKAFLNFRSILASIDFDFITIRSTLFGRTILNLISLSILLTRLQYFSGIATDTINLDSSVERTALFDRIATDDITINTLITRTGVMFRLPIDSIDINTLTSRLRLVPRTITDTITFSDTLQRRLFTFRIILLPIKIVTEIPGAIKSYTYPIIDSFDITTTTDRTGELSRPQTDIIDIGSLTSRFQILFRTPIQTINIDILINRVGNFFRLLINAISIDDLTSRFAEFIRRVIQTIVITIPTDTRSHNATINIYFTNTTDFATYVNSVDEGENFFFWWNWTNDLGEVITNESGECNFTAYNVVIEAEASNQSFDLCDAGKGCDIDNPLKETFVLEVSNVTEPVTKDFVRLEICHADKIKQGLDVTFECGAVTETILVDLAEFGLCTSGFSEVIVESFVCMNALSVNITLDNNVNNYNQRQNISVWELDRELLNHTDTYADNEVEYNLTYNLWKSINNYERYTHGQVQLDVICAYTGNPTYNADATSNLTIVNRPPIILPGQVFMPSGLDYPVNATDITVPEVYVYENGEWQWIVPIVDDDVDTHNETWYNSSGDAILSFQHEGNQSDHNSTNQVFINYLNENTYNFTIWANDTFGNFTITSFYFNLTYATPTRTISDIIASNVFVDRTMFLIRSPIALIDITTLVERVSNLIVVVIDSIRIESFVDRVGSIIKNILENIGITTEAKGDGPPQILIEVIIPSNTSETIEVDQDQFFQVSVNVTCLNANCGLINVSFDPETGYPILFDSFESGWGAPVEAENCFGADDCSNIGEFTNCNNNSGDFDFCATTDSDAVNSGSAGLLLEGWAGGNVTSELGIWYNFNPSTACGGDVCDYITLDMWMGEEGLDGGSLPERGWLTEQNGSGTPVAVAMISDGDGKTLINFVENFTGDLSSTSWNARIMAKMGGTAEEIFIDDINITGYKETISINESTINITEQISVSDYLNRLSQFERIANQTVSFDILLLRTAVLTQGVSNIISLDTITIRSNLLSASVADSLSLTIVSERSFSVVRDTLAKMNIITSIERTAYLVQPIVDSVDLTQIVNRIGYLSKAFSDLVSFDTLVNKGRASSRSIFDNLSVTSVSSRLQALLRVPLTRIEINAQLVSVGATHTTELITESFDVAAITDRIRYVSRVATDFISIDSFVERSRLVVRSLAESITIDSFISRLQTLIRMPSDSIVLSQRLVGLESTGIKDGLISTVIGATPFYTINDNPYEIELNNGESQIVTININATGAIDTTHIFYVYANMTSNMSVSNITERWNVTIKDLDINYYNASVSNIIAVDTSVNRLADLIRWITNIFNMDQFIDRLAIMTKTILQTIIHLFRLDAVAEMWRSIFDELGIDDFISRLEGLLRGVSERIEITTIIKIMLAPFRLILLPIDITDGVIRIQEVTKEQADSIEIVSIVYRILGSDRTVYDNIDIVIGLDALGSLKRNTVVFIDFVDSLFTFRKLPTDVSDTISFASIIQRKLTAFRVIFQPIDIFETIPGAGIVVQSYTRLIVDQIDVDTIVTRLTELVRTPTQTVNINTYVTKFRSLTGTLFDNVQLTTIINRFLSSDRGLNEIIVFDTFVSREGNLFRTITQIIDINTATERILTRIRNVADNISVDDFVERTAVIQRIINQIIEIFITGEGPALEPSFVLYVLPDTNDVPYVHLNETLTFGDPVPYTQLNEQVSFV